MFRPRLPVALAAALVLSGLVGCASLEAARLADRGSRAIDRGDAALAVVDLEAAVDLMPESAPIVNNLGVAYLAAGRPDAALAAFERAVALDCDHQPAQRNLRALQRDRSTLASGASSQAP